MKHLLLAATAAIALSASTAIAQQADGSLAYDAAILQAFSDASQDAPPAISQFVSGQSGGQLLASDLIDRGVYNSSMSLIGAVVDVLIDTPKAAVVVDVGEFLGGERKHVAFPSDHLRYKNVDNEIRLVVEVDRTALENADEFKPLAEAAALNDFQGTFEEPTHPTPEKDATSATQ